MAESRNYRTLIRDRVLSANIHLVSLLRTSARRCLILFLCLCFNVSHADTDGPVVMEKGKLKLLVPIMNHVTWPDEASSEYFTVGLYGKDEKLESLLKRELKKLTIRGKPLRVRTFETTFEARSAHVLMVSRAENPNVPDIVRRLNKNPTLVVTDASPDKREVMINFIYKEGSRLSFEVNRTNIIYTGLQLSKDILVFGGTKLDIAALHKETEDELRRAVSAVKNQQKVLLSQETKLADQQKELLKQGERIAEKESELRILERNIFAIQSTLQKSEQALEHNQASLSEKESVLAEKEESINRYSSNIEKNLARLAQLQEQINERESLINDKDRVLSKQGVKIKSQQTFLMVAGAMLSLVLILIIIIFASYRSKHKANQMLEQKTLDLEATMEELHSAQEALISSKHVVSDHLNSIATFVDNLGIDREYAPLTLRAETGEESTDSRLTLIVNGINETSKALISDHRKLSNAEHELRAKKDQLEALVKEINELNTELEFKVRERTRELEAANIQLQKMAEAKGQFLSSMSHEIRTPLNGVLGMVELLKDTEINSQQERYLDTIHTSGEVLLGVINDILDFSKIEAGKMTIENIDYNLEKLVFGCGNIFAMRSAVGIAFIVDVSENTPILVKGDPTRIRQVLLNLLSNAFKFTERGQIRLQASEAEPTGSADNPQRWIRISVSDTGTGLSEEHCSNIFDAFTQADTSTTRRFGGTGLGLAISQRLSSLMEGSLSVESELGVGSTFSLTLPLIESDVFTTTRDQTLKNHSILFVCIPDDQLPLVDHAKTWGMTVHMTHSIEASHKFLDSSHTDIIVLPEHIDEHPGLILASEISRGANAAPVLLLSNHSAPLPSEEIAKSDIVDVLQVPLAPSLFRDTLIKHVCGQSPDAGKVRDAANKKKDLQYSNMKVLVAEDNPVNQMVIKGFLARMGITPELANNGIEAVDHYRQQLQNSEARPPFDLILMDCEMPELDGLEATRQIRTLEATDKIEHTNIVALTAHAMDEHRKKAMAAGMDGHLAKPLKREALEDLLSQLNILTNAS